MQDNQKADKLFEDRLEIGSGSLKLTNSKFM